MRFDDLVGWDTGFTLEAVNVLREEFEELALFVQERDEGVRDCGPVAAGVEFVGEGIEGKGVSAEIGDVEDRFCVGEI